MRSMTVSRSARRSNVVRGGVLACAAASLFGAMLALSSSAQGSAPPVGRSASTASVFGKTSVGASTDTFGYERKRVNRYALPEAGSVSKLSIYLAPGGTPGQQVLEGLLY